MSTRGRRWRPVAQSLSRGVPRGGRQKLQRSSLCAPWLLGERPVTCGFERMFAHLSAGGCCTQTLVAVQQQSCCHRHCARAYQLAQCASVAVSLRWELGAFTALAESDDTHRGVAALVGRAPVAGSTLGCITAPHAASTLPAAVTLEVLQSRPLQPAGGAAAHLVAVAAPRAAAVASKPLAGVAEPSTSSPDARIAYAASAARRSPALVWACSSSLEQTRADSSRNSSRLE